MPRGGRGRKMASSLSARAGLQLSVDSVKNYLTKYLKNILFNGHDYNGRYHLPKYTLTKKSKKVCGITAPIYLSGVIEYLCVEILDRCDNEKNKINSFHMIRRILLDSELFQLFEYEIHAFNPSLYPSKISLDTNIIPTYQDMSSEDFQFGEFNCKLHIIEMIKSNDVQITAFTVSTLLNYANHLYVKMIENIDIVSPFDKIKNQDLFGLIPIHISDNILEVVINEIISKEDSIREKEAFIIHYIIKFAISIILTKANDLNKDKKTLQLQSREQCFAEDEKNSNVSDDKNNNNFLIPDYDNNDKYVNLDKEISTCISCMTMVESEHTLNQTDLNEVILSSVIEKLQLKPNQNTQNNLADVMLMELEISLGGMQILLLDDNYITKCIEDTELFRGNRLTSGARKFVQLLIDLIFRLIIENAIAIAMMNSKTKLTVDNSHIAKAVLILNLETQWHPKFEDDLKIFQQNELTSSLDSTAKVALLNFGRFLVKDIILLNTCLHVFHRRKRTFGIHEVVSAITNLSCIDVFEFALMKQCSRAAKSASLQEMKTVLMRLSQHGLFYLYPQVVKNIRCDFEDIAIDRIEAPISIKMKLLSLFNDESAETIFETKREIKSRFKFQVDHSVSDLPLDPKRFILIETSRRKNFSLPTTALPKKLLEPFYELYSVYSNISIFNFYVGAAISDKLLLKNKRNVTSKPCIVVENKFHENWNNMTLNVFDSIDMSNCFIAGGSILNCLLEDRDITVSKGSIDNKSDIDVFIWGLSTEEAEAKLSYVIDSICKSRKRIAENLKIIEPISMLSVSQYAVTLLGYDVFRPIQFILRQYRTPSEVLQGFDIDSCCVGYDLSTECVYANPRGWRAIVTRCNSVDTSRRSPSYESRLIKYSQRGFAVYMGKDFQRTSIDHNKVKLSILSGLGKKGIMKLISEDFLQNYREDFRDKKIKGFYGYFPSNSNYVKKFSYEEDSDFWGMIEAYGSQIDKKFACIDFSNEEVGLDNEELVYLTDNQMRMGNKKVTYRKIFSTTDLKSFLIGLNWLVENPSRQGLLTGSFEPIECDDDDFYQLALWKYGVEEPITQDYFRFVSCSLELKNDIYGEYNDIEGCIEEDWENHCVLSSYIENEIDVQRVTRHRSEIDDFQGLVSFDGISFLSSLNLLNVNRHAVVSVFYQVHHQKMITSKAESLLLALLSSALYKIVHESFRMMRSNKKEVLSSREIQSGVRAVLFSELQKFAVKEGVKACTKFNSR